MGRHEQRTRAREEHSEYLETSLERLQDSVYREAVGRAHDLEEIDGKIQPGKMARELGKHVRQHGL